MENIRLKAGGALTKDDAKELHRAFKKLRVGVSDAEVKDKRVGPSTSKAIKQIQIRHKLTVDGKLNEDTIKALNVELFDDHHTTSKTRTAHLHTMLEKIGVKLDPAERRGRLSGDGTRKAIKEFQKKAGLPTDGVVSGDLLASLDNEVIRATFSSKRQVGKLQKAIGRIANITKLPIDIAANELKGKQLGASTSKAIKEIQAKYKLPQTGKLDRATLDRIDSVVASRGVPRKTLAKSDARSLTTIDKNLRLNMVSPKVGEMQTALAYLGHSISEHEFKTQEFGKSTRKAILELQNSNGLPETGHLDNATRRVVNSAVIAANPGAAPSGLKYHVRGSVRDELLRRKSGMVIHVYEKLLDGESAQPLATKMNHKNGFFDIAYSPPIDPATGRPKEKFHLTVKLLDAGDNELDSRIYYNVPETRWANFNMGAESYRGDSEFATFMRLVVKALGAKEITDVEETANNKQVTHLSVDTGLSTDDVMRLVLSHLVEKDIKVGVLNAEVVYALIRQNVPASLPGDLLRGTNEWESIDAMTELAASGLAFTDDSVLEKAIDSAVANNVVSLQVKQDRQTILGEFVKLRTRFTLSKPILIGNGSLETLLGESEVGQIQWHAVANAFIANRGINDEFWAELKSLGTIGDDALGSLATIVDLGNISKNHLPTIQFIKNNTGPEPGKRFKAVRDLAKLSEPQLESIIHDNGDQVPDNIPDAASYAEVLKARAEVRFPATALVAEVKRGSDDHELTKLNEVDAFVDEHAGDEFRTKNIDKTVSDLGLTLDDKTREEIKIFQRVQKLTTEAVTGRALIEEKLHNSAQIYFAGKNRLANLLEARGVDRKYAFKLYERAHLQYVQVLGRILEFTPEIHVGTPAAVSSPTYTKDDIRAALGDIPNIETLFGSFDFCECEHCKSLYGPAAYLVDVLRFLGEQDSLVERSGRLISVKDVLLERRPDLGSIDLNCENTNTVLPYIDLVCEILENAIEPEQSDFAHNTTMTSEELRAIPQYMRPHAYTVLSTADYPMHSCFNLWQEEARTYLDYLRVARHELMKRFQNMSDPANKAPTDASIAGEYFGISSYEMSIVTTQAATPAEQDTFWGAGGAPSSPAVADLLDNAKLSYRELLELLLVRFVNDPEPPSRSVVVRPPDTCDVVEQTVSNMSPGRYDLAHRFLRLWRKTGWQMWELDLLIRNAKIGGGAIDDDGDTIVNLKRFKELQERLRIPFEIALAFFGDINTEQRVKPDTPDVEIDSLYRRLFQNLAISNPTDAHFALPLDTDIVLGENTATPFDGYSPVPTVLSALALGQTDFDTLKSKTDGKLSLTSLSELLRYTYLARGLKLRVDELWSLMRITNTDDPFTSVQATLDFIEHLDAIRGSGLSLAELDYVLNFDSESPVGLRSESVTTLIEALRKTLSTSEDTMEQLSLTDTAVGDIVSFDADALAAMSDADVLTSVQALRDLLDDLRAGFEAGNFSLEEADHILEFDSAAGMQTDNLIAAVKRLQENVSSLVANHRNQIVSHVATSFGISDQQSDILLSNLESPGAASTLIGTLTDKALITPLSDGSLPAIDEATYPDHYVAHALLHKVAVLLQRTTIDTKDLEWFVTNHAAAKTIDLSSLPVAATTGPNGFEKWLRLHKLLSFIARFPEPEDASMRAILDKARDAGNAKSDILDLLAQLTQWNRDEIRELDAGLALKHHATDGLDYLEPDVYGRMLKCFEQMSFSGVGARLMFEWADRDTSGAQPDIALQTRQAIKSKYETDEWLEKITPLQDALRDKKRAALVAYHIEHSRRNQLELVGDGGDVPNPLFWKDSTALFNYFLIDVEMSACQLTSRIKLALSSIQLFVQRCFLNLETRYVQVSMEEKLDEASENAWSQWKWMKNYRIWEANRKVFFYPENWIEPELRDDKSPFFKELEDEILQKEITHDNVESAFLNYLHKVDAVSRLEVCGLYHEMEELNAHELGYEINTVHVIGRTRSVPHVYYYRSYDMNYSYWTAWEKIEADIESDHVIPVVYNRKLHLFWLVFTEKAQKLKKRPAAKPSDGPKDTPEAPTLLELELAWCVRRHKGWSSRQVSGCKLIHPWERPRYAYNLKPFYKASTNELWLDVYLSTCKEFNDGKFYDQVQDQLVEKTGNRFNETYLPWHSSSFVFDGEVKDVKFKGLHGYYNFEFSATSSASEFTDTIETNSFEYVNNNFGEDGRKIKQFESDEDGPRLALPNGMHFHNTYLTNNRYSSANRDELRVLEGTNTVTLTQNALNPFQLVFTQQDLQFDTRATDHPFFYQDSERSFFLRPEWKERLDEYGRVIARTKQYRAKPFYHPYTSLFIRELNREGLDGLLTRKVQVEPQKFEPKNTFSFSHYQPTSRVVADETVVQDTVDFSFGGACSIYNWEVFFHAPMMIATRLTQNQRFEDAMRWFHYVFDPTNVEDLPTPQRYWVTKPFYENSSEDYRTQRIENILANLDLDENQEQLKAWRNSPFNPHIIARYRPVAYQRNVVMKYLDNLIAWGDQLFRRDSIESINEASLLYLLAYEILGERPKKVPNVEHEDLTFNEIGDKLDDIGNARVDVLIEDTLLPMSVEPSRTGTEPMPRIETFYFCIPNNDRILKYWDTIEERMFKIRHCQNIEGVERQLALFEPPIDPALLVKAAAAGLDLSSVLNDIATGTPHYRFRVVVQKAIEFCGDVKQLGDKLLRALESKDAEGLALLRSQHEIQILEAVKAIRSRQVDEAGEVLGGYNSALASATEKRDYYTSREFMSGGETAAMALGGTALGLHVVGTILEAISGVVGVAVPDFYVGAAGFGGSPVAVMHVGGGTKAASGLQAGARVSYQVAAILDRVMGIVSTVAGYTRRMDDWEFQGRLAEFEMDQMQFQINAGEIRQAIAERELENQELQIENSKTTDDYMRNKYTNQQLYNWMVTQISTTYFQAYQLAYDMAKKAEKCCQHELGIRDSSYIEFGYWDSLKKGLLSGDKLLHDLHRLEAAYIDQNKRELELVKHISLAQVSPLSLMTLKETGKCTIALPEWLFDMDYPGHYMRRIKSVSISIPCVAGPFTSVNCTLSLKQSETRVDTTPGSQYSRVDENDSRFIIQRGAISSIATSSAQSDSGLFELNFNDERYLPFERTGAISEWELSMPKERNYFDLSTISDIILHMSYTARSAGGQLALDAGTHLDSVLPSQSARLFAMKHGFSTEWHKFLNPSGGADQELVVQITKEHYPFFLRNSLDTLKIKKLEVFIASEHTGDFEIKMKVSNADYESDVSDVSPSPELSDAHHTTRDYSTGIKPDALGELRLKLRVKGGPGNFTSLTDQDLSDLFVLYHVSP